MKNIETLKNDIHNIMKIRNKYLYDKKFCDVCFHKIRKYDLQRHINMSNHDEILENFINECNDRYDMSYDEIIQKYLRIADFYHDKFQFL